MTIEGVRGDIIIAIQGIFLPLTCVITYCIATSLDHVEDRFPYISDTGTYSPESCIFGLLLAFYSITSFVTVYGRWRMVCNQYLGTRWTPRLNNTALVLGMVAALGVLLVANFQETKVISVHLIGAFMAFFIGAFYMWLQTVVSYRIPALSGHSKFVCHFRLVVTILTTCCAFLTGGLAAIAEGQKPANHTKTDEPGTGMWYSWMDGYELHIASTSFEWALAGLVSIYFLTFFSEFKRIRIGMPAIHSASTDDISYHSDGGYIGPGAEEQSQKF